MQGYYGLPSENRRALLMTLAKEYDLNRKQVRELMRQYLGLELPSSKMHVSIYFQLFFVNVIDFDYMLDCFR